MTQQLLYTFLEIYRRLLYFHGGDLDHNLMLLTFPSKVKDAITQNFIEPYSKEIPKSNNWYKLTNKGKDFFKEFVKDTVNEHINEILFEKSRWSFNEGVDVFENVKNRILSHYNTFKF